MSIEETIQELEFCRDMCRFNPNTGETGYQNKENEHTALAMEKAIEIIKGQPESVTKERVATFKIKAPFVDAYTQGWNDAVDAILQDDGQDIEEDEI